MRNDTVQLSHGLAGFSLVQLSWAGLSGLAAHSLDMGCASGAGRQRSDRSGCLRWW
jgi:hypothetical protein